MSAKAAPKPELANRVLKQWRVHTPRLLEEVFENPGTSALRMPFNIFGKILFEVGERAAELDDPQLNALMVRLTIYSVADPMSPDYDKDVVERVIDAAALTRATPPAKETGR